MPTTKRPDKVRLTCPCCAEVTKISTRHEGCRFRCPTCGAKVRFKDGRLIDLKAERRERRRREKEKERRRIEQRREERRRDEEWDEQRTVEPPQPVFREAKTSDKKAHTEAVLIAGMITIVGIVALYGMTGRVWTGALFAFPILTVAIKFMHGSAAKPIGGAGAA